MENKKSEQEKTKIIIRQEQNKGEGPHLNWGTYIHQVNVFKWWILGVTLVGAIAGYTGAKFVLNPRRENITSTLSYSLPLNKDSSEFIDGSSFDGRDLISASNIKAVIESEDSFKKLDADGIYRSRSISAVETTTETGTTSSKTDFVLNTKVQAFGSSALAKSFIEALINYQINNVFLPKIENRKLATPFKRNKEEDLASRESRSFEKTTQSLVTLCNNLSDNYKTLLNEFNSSIMIGGNNSLLSLSNDFSSTASSVDELKGDFYANYYINFKDGDEDALRQKYIYLGKSYKDSLSALQEKLNVQKSLLNQLTSISKPDYSISKQINEVSEEASALSSQIKELTESLEKIGYTITVNTDGDTLVSDTPDALEGFYPSINFYKENKDSTDSAKKKKALEWKTGCEEYMSRVETRYDELSNEYQIATNASRTLYKNYNRAIYIKEADYGTLSGHISSTLVAAVGLVLGFFASSLLLAAIGRNIEYKKKKEVMLLADKNEKGTIEPKVNNADISSQKAKDGSKKE